VSTAPPSSRIGLATVPVVQVISTPPATVGTAAAAAAPTVPTSSVPRAMPPLPVLAPLGSLDPVVTIGHRMDGSRDKERAAESRRGEEGGAAAAGAGGRGGGNDGGVAGAGMGAGAGAGGTAGSIGQLAPRSLVPGKTAVADDKTGAGVADERRGSVEDGRELMFGAQKAQRSVLGRGIHKIGKRLGAKKAGK
jgi:hypothetical protein